MHEISPLVRLSEELLQLSKFISGTGTQPSSREDARALEQQVYQSSLKAQNVCNDILRELMGPLEYTSVIAQSCQESCALQFVTELDISDLIGDGAKSLADISSETGVDPVSLNVALNCVKGRGYFKETESGSQIYQNTDLSRLLSSKSTETLKDTVGLAADDALSATPYLLASAKSGQAGRRLPAYNIAHNFTSTIFEWMSSPEQSWRGQRVGLAMKQSHGFANKHVTDDYSWNDLASPIIDMGGGIGSLEMTLLKDQTNQQLSFTIFDIPQTIENAQKQWSDLPKAMSTRVSFVSGSFLDQDLSTSNIPQNQSTYLIRHVLFDWTDAEVLVILQNVRNAMNADGAANKAGRKLVLCEMLLPEQPTQYIRQISMQVLVLNNGYIRTQAHMTRLMEEAGFVIKGVHHMRAVDSIIEAHVL